jgi:ankyrin repeat protein
MLIKRGADMKTQNKAGETPLHNAVTTNNQVSRQRRAEIARIFLEHGVDATIRDKSGNTPFDLASKHTKAVFLRHGATPG